MPLDSRSGPDQTPSRFENDPAPQASAFRGETKLDRSAKDFRHRIGKPFAYVIAKGR
jgi:hypothetical protein